MRKAVVAVLGLPVIGALYLIPVARRTVSLRVAILLVAGGLLTLASAGSKAQPVSAYKTPPIDPQAAARMAVPVVTDFSVHRSVQFDFNTPMNEPSVAAALSVDPQAATRLTWSADGRHLRVAPTDAWQPGRLYAIRIDSSARDRAGAALGAPVSAVFLTRERPTASLALTKALDAHAHPSTAIAIAFSEPVESSAVLAALSVKPVLAGRLLTVPGEASGPMTNDHFQWIPDAPLAPGVAYRFTLAATVPDADGVTLASAVALDLSTAARPAVVRTRPAPRQTGIERNQVISVRFTTKMDRASTQAAFHVSGLDAAKDGTFRWYERDTVVAWTPRHLYDYGRTYTVTIDGTAASAAGITLGPSASSGAVHFGFTIVAKPAPPPTPRPASRPRPTPRPTVSPTSSSPWYAVELYYLSLLNCVHTGGWVHSDGSCTGRGTNGLAPYRLNAGISNNVTRPWAKYLAQTGQLYHGCPGCRLAAAGYTSAYWGENLGWWSGDPYTGAIKVVLFFESEKPYNGGHWRNLMSSAFHSIGIGVWMSGGRAVYNSDFYGP